MPPYVVAEFEFIIHNWLQFCQRERFLKLKKLRKTQRELPIYAHRTDIIESIDSSNVVIIAGDTGCGKSTQVNVIYFVIKIGRHFLVNSVQLLRVQNIRNSTKIRRILATDSTLMLLQFLKSVNRRLSSSAHELGDSFIFGHSRWCCSYCWCSTAEFSIAVINNDRFLGRRRYCNASI